MFFIIILLILIILLVFTPLKIKIHIIFNNKKFDLYLWKFHIPLKGAKLANIITKIKENNPLSREGASQEEVKDNLKLKKKELRFMIETIRLGQSFETVDLNIRFGLDDPMLTSLLYGTLLSINEPILIFLKKFIVIKNIRLTPSPVMGGACLDFDFKTVTYIRLNILITRYLKYRKTFKKERK